MLFADFKVKIRNLFLLYCLKCFIKILNDVPDILCSDGKTDRGGRDVLLGELLGRELGVRGGSRVHDERLDVGHVGEQREHLQMIDELPCSLLATLNLKGKDRGTATGEVLLIELVIGVLRQARVIHLGDVAVTSQELNDLLGVRHGGQRAATESRCPGAEPRR